MKNSSFITSQFLPREGDRLRGEGEKSGKRGMRQPISCQPLICSDNNATWHFIKWAHQRTQGFPFPFAGNKNKTQKSQPPTNLSLFLSLSRGSFRTEDSAAASSSSSFQREREMRSDLVFYGMQVDSDLFFFFFYSRIF